MILRNRTTPQHFIPHRNRIGICEALNSPDNASQYKSVGRDTILIYIKNRLIRFVKNGFQKMITAVLKNGRLIPHIIKRNGKRFYSKNLYKNGKLVIYFVFIQISLSFLRYFEI